MKKLNFRRFAILFTIFSVTFAFALLPWTSPIFAAENDDVEDRLEEEVDKSLENIDWSELERLFEELSDEKFSFGNSIKQIISGVLDGTVSLDASVVFRLIGDALFSGFRSILPIMVLLFALILLFRIFTSMVSGFKRESIKNIVYFVYYFAVVSILTVAVSNCIKDTVTTVKVLEKVTDVLFPILLTLLTAVGGVSSVAVYQPLMLILPTVIIKTVNAVVIPLFLATVIFTVVGGMSKNVPLGKLTKTTKSISEWILGGMFAIFISIATIQGILGATADSVSIKSMKFALSSYVPILGGYLSDGFDLVMAGCILIKNAVGLTGVILVIVTALLPIAKILLYSISFRLVAAVSEPLGETRFSSLLYSLGKNLTTLIAIIAGIAFLVLILIIVVLTSCNPGAL